MPGISKKLVELIGDQSVKSWAESYGLPVQTVHEWVKHDRKPSKGNLQTLINATGIAKDWWLSNDESIIETPYPKFTDSQRKNNQQQNLEAYSPDPQLDGVITPRLVAAIVSELQKWQLVNKKILSPVAAEKAALALLDLIDGDETKINILAKTVLKLVA